MSEYPVPGRGAWRITGGLLPVPVKSTSRVGYYRLATAGETAIGSGWLTHADRSHHAHVVHLGVKALQGLIGAEQDGWLGPQSAARIRSAQEFLGIEVDGIAGRATLRALLAEVVKDAAGATSVPAAILGGILAHESSLDPAAVGLSGFDHGLAQINLGAHGDSVTLEEALDPHFAAHWTGEDLAHVHDTWLGKTRADPWDIAIAHHNSPRLAKRWAVEGHPPIVPDRAFQISEYVDAVRDAW